MLLLALALTLQAGPWIDLTAHGGPPKLEQEVVRYAGGQLVVAGKGEGGYTGAVLDLATLRWRKIPPLPVEQVDAPAWAPKLPEPELWRGELLFYFGHRPAEPAAAPRPFATGARFDLARGRWRPMSAQGAAIRDGAAFVSFGGGRLAVFRAPVAGVPLPGGAGAVYDAAADRWTPIPEAGAPQTDPSARYVWSGVLAGPELLVFGRGEGADLRRAGKAELDFGCDLASGAWRPLPPGAPLDTFIPVAHWDGRRALVAGAGADLRSLAGGLYDPAADRWTALPPLASPTAVRPMAVNGRAARVAGDALVVQTSCPGSRGRALAVFRPGAAGWSVKCLGRGGEPTFDGDRVLLVGATRPHARRPQAIPFAVFDPARDRLVTGTLPGEGAPLTFQSTGNGPAGQQSPGHLHFDGRRFFAWGGFYSEFDPGGRNGCEGFHGPGGCDPVTPMRWVELHGGHAVAPRLAR